MSMRSATERTVTAGGQTGCRPAFVQPRAGPTVVAVGIVMTVGTVGGLLDSLSVRLRSGRSPRRSLVQRSRPR
jgi:hypothetical protein